MMIIFLHSINILITADDYILDLQLFIGPKQS